MATAENNIFLNPAVLEADTAPAPRLEVVARFASLDFDLTSRSSVFDALCRRLSQIKGIGALLGTVDRTFNDVPDHAFSNASWALQDLTAEAEELASMLYRMAPDEAASAES